MTQPLRADEVHRTALLWLHDESQATIEDALAAHAATGVLVCAGTQACTEPAGQAALLTAVLTGVRAFGRVHVVLADPNSPISARVERDLTLAEVIKREGAELAPSADLAVGESWPAVLIGADSAMPASTIRRPVLRVSWSGWVARVAPAMPNDQTCTDGCVLAAIAAGAIGISEAFAAVRAAPGNDGGFRPVTLNLWNSDAPADDHGPALAHAPHAWWLVGLGHLGQAYAWVISWLPYADPSSIDIVLQDTDRTVPANHSTGVLTPRASDGVRKTRLIDAALTRAGFEPRMIERRLDGHLRADATEAHVALLGVDNLPTRLLISSVDWHLAIDAGLGATPADFSSMLLRRFPGAQTSDQIEAWRSRPTAITVPTGRAFSDLLRHRDKCGVIELAGKAVGVPFVGVVAACLAIAEACRGLHGGAALDVLTYDLTTTDLRFAAAADPVVAISAPLRNQH
ncbi:hypothetical protein [Frankia sp. Cr1]|uniref:hypothetical protein n=1 Tax=Frankia sp. Cr1 TaxID=3073931 RepID=UPI002AD1FA32|nr:hypothetical protein [Frankia sp. Cr1]